MSIEVVVVLPAVPVTIRVVSPAISLASTTGRISTGIPRRLASTSSGLVFGMAAWVVITAVGPPGSRSSDDASWPIRISAPRARQAQPPAGFLGVRAGAQRAAVEQDPRDPGHACTADADQVHPL